MEYARPFIVIVVTARPLTEIFRPTAGQPVFPRQNMSEDEPLKSAKLNLKP